jgi:hypothetical protein
MVSGPASFARPLPAQVLRAASSQVYSPARCGNACFWDTSLQCTASAPRRKEKLRRVAFDARPVAAMVEGTPIPPRWANGRARNAVCFSAASEGRSRQTRSNRYKSLLGRHGGQSYGRGHSVGRNPSSPVCSVCRFDRTAFLLPGWPLRPKAQIANPAHAAKKKPRAKVSSGKLDLMDSTTPTPNAQPTPKPTR